MKQPIDMMLDGVQWITAPEQSEDASGLPYVTHSGVLEIFDVKLRVYRLSDGMTVIDADDMNALCGAQE